MRICDGDDGDDDATDERTVVGMVMIMDDDHGR